MLFLVIDKNYLDKFLSKNDYDIRKRKNARWIDQKCTPDVLSIVSESIIEYISNNNNLHFTSSDIWKSEFSRNNILEIFKKPDPAGLSTKNEYDKFFQQPMELLAYSGILSKKVVNRRNTYSINNFELLQALAISEKNSIKFLSAYIEKVLKDSEIYGFFDSFFSNPNKLSYLKVKNTFTEFIIYNTPINKNTEVWRMFIKVLNPLSYIRNTYGTEKGRISKKIVSHDMLMYNRDNFRDLYKNKPKTVARKDFIEEKRPFKYYEYLTQKAMKYVKLYNKQFNKGMSEVNSGDIEFASEVHHIFPRSSHSSLSHYLENMINLTPNQHRNSAHKNSNFSSVDLEFQKICLISKAKTIKESAELNLGDYEFEKFLHVLNVGFNTNAFKDFDITDLAELFLLINTL
jgi:hypothetical protein